MDIELLGLKTCDTCRSARRALAEAGHRVAFRDVRDDPLGPDEIAELLSLFGDALINRRSATWRGLDAADQAATPDRLLARHPAVMKRPVLMAEGARYLGWTAEAKAALL